MTTFMRVVLPSLFALAAGGAQAALIDRGGGMIYDTDISVTWYAGDLSPASNSFGLPLGRADIDGNPIRQGGAINLDGSMSWDIAVQWIAAINGANFQGYSDWRLPYTPATGSDCPDGIYSLCGGEMGHLLFGELGRGVFGFGTGIYFVDPDGDIRLFPHLAELDTVGAARVKVVVASFTQPSAV